MKGTPASPMGTTAGYIVFVNNIKDVAKIKNNSILAAKNTYPELFESITKSRAVLTVEGGITMHAAIVCREIGKPCVLDLKQLFSFKEGDYVLVNSDEGIIKKIKPRKRIQSDKWKQRPFVLWYYILLAKYQAAMNLNSSFIKDVDLKIEKGTLHLDRVMEELHLEKIIKAFRKDAKKFCSHHINNANKGIKGLKNLHEYLKKSPLDIESYKHSLIAIEALGRCVILSRYPIPEMIEKEILNIVKDTKTMHILATTSTITTKDKHNEELFKQKKKLLQEYKSKNLRYLLKLLEHSQKVREESHHLLFQKIYPLLVKMIKKFGKDKEYYLPSEIIKQEKPNITLRKKGEFIMDYNIIMEEIKLLKS
ncbi:MAG: PEP-utilizing enzyme [archaeon]